MYRARKDGKRFVVVADADGKLLSRHPAYEMVFPTVFTADGGSVAYGVKDGQKTLLTDMLGDNLSDLRSGDLRKAIRKGDKFVDKVVEDASEYIGIATANLVNILNPEVVVLGGGVIEALQDEMMSVIVETAKDYAMPGSMKGVEIIASKLGDNAGITGGAVLARRETK